MGMELFHSGGWTTIHYTEGVEPTILVQYLEDGITVHNSLLLMDGTIHYYVICSDELHICGTVDMVDDGSTY